MMKVFIASHKQFTELNAEWIEVETATGSVIIQKNHAPTVMRIKPGSILTIQGEHGAQEILKDMSGIVHVQQNGVTIIIY